MPKFARFPIVALLAAASPAAADSPNQFDLICNGTEQKATGKPAIAWTERFRLDLDAKRWCRGACAEPAEIGSVTADRIVIPNSRAATGGPASAELSFSRNDGAVKEYTYAGWSGSTFGLAEGSCRREYFSGFPVRRF